VRALDKAITALALRALPAIKLAGSELPPAAVMDRADAALLDRAALNKQRAALIASLWPEARPCVVPALYSHFPAPALLGSVMRVSWRPPAGVDAPPLQLDGSGQAEFARAA